MNLLFLTNELSYRGTPRFLFHCARLAQKNGHCVRVWGLERGGALEAAFARLSIPVQIGLDAVDAALGFQPRLVHVHRSGGVSDRDNALLRLLKGKTGCRVLETNVFGTADLTVPDPIDLHAHISRWDLWRWRRWLWPFRRAGIYLPYCLDTDELRPVPAEAFRHAHGLAPDDFVVGRIGKTDWPRLRAALVPALRACPQIRLVSVDDYAGREMDLADWPPDVRSRIARIPVLSGPDALSAFYSACDLTVSVSPIGESFGYVVAESMACGTPVVAFSMPRNDNAQIEIAAAACGSHPVRDAAAAADVITACARRPPTAEQKRLCRESIVRRYGTSTFAPALETAYRLLAADRARGRALERAFADAGFTTDISDGEIGTSLASVHGGGPSPWERAKMRLAYSLPNAMRIQAICRRTFPSPVPEALKERT
ncbi:MAG: glycosyltransferase [Kiritimatiellia bacterium]